MAVVRSEDRLPAGCKGKSNLDVVVVPGGHLAMDDGAFAALVDRLRELGPEVRCPALESCNSHVYFRLRCDLRNLGGIAGSVRRGKCLLLVLSLSGVKCRFDLCKCHARTVRTDRQLQLLAGVRSGDCIVAPVWTNAS
mgnify:CR=1 FL=1